MYCFSVITEHHRQCQNSEESVHSPLEYTFPIYFISRSKTLFGQSILLWLFNEEQK